MLERASTVIRPGLLTALVFLAGIFMYGHANAQNAETERSQVSPSVHLEAGPGDRAAASHVVVSRPHLLLIRTTRLDRKSPVPFPATSSKSQLASADHETTNSDANSSGHSIVPTVPPPGFYPADVANTPPIGPIVNRAQQHPLYVNCSASCWGNPEPFLRNLDKSSFIHVVDQYVGSTVDDRYTLGTSGSITYPIGSLTDNDIFQIVHTGAQAFGTGYHHIYHVFIPEGVDVCFAGTSVCYSPDNPSTFSFCAYHDSVTFSDIGHVLFTVEPFQNVPSCAVAEPSPNGVLVDSTSNILAHEVFETITDPDLDAWYAQNSLLLFNLNDVAEIADLCESPLNSDSFFTYGTISVNGTEYEIQPIYSNDFHGCVYVPFRGSDVQ